MEKSNLADIFFGMELLKTLVYILNDTKVCFYCKQKGHWVEDCGNIGCLKKEAYKEKHSKAAFDMFY